MSNNTVEKLPNGKFQGRMWFESLHNGIVGDECDTPQDAANNCYRKYQEAIRAIETLIQGPK